MRVLGFLLIPLRIAWPFQSNSQDIKGFVLRLLEASSDSALITLCDPGCQGLSLVREIAQCHERFVLDTRGKGNEVSFQRVALGLLTLLSRLENSTNVTAVNAVVASLMADRRFVVRCVELASRLAAREDWQVR
jgi:hypothetical protein